MEQLLQEINTKLDKIIALLEERKRNFTITVNPELYYPRNSDPPPVINCDNTSWPQPERYHIQ